MAKWCRLVSLFVALIALACGDDIPAPADPDGGPEPDASIPEGFVPGVIGTWELAPGEEAYLCVYARIDEEMFVDGFSALTPLGTHHTLLTVLPETLFIDSVVKCGPSTLGDATIYGAGVGTEVLELPQETAVRLEEGQQLLLNLHLFNTSDRTLSGQSGVYFRRRAPEEVRHDAQVRLVGTQSFSIPPRSQGYTVSGGCTLAHDQTLFAILPHMHWYGVGQRASIIRQGSSEPEVFFDSIYSFDDQRYRMLDPIQLRAGDFIQVECTYNNSTDTLVTYGDSTREEMCFGAIFAYPATGEQITCID